jgi:hypothetical protein
MLEEFAMNMNVDGGPADKLWPDCIGRVELVDDGLPIAVRPRHRSA